jgi:hypothetical protein
MDGAFKVLLSRNFKGNILEKYHKYLTIRPDPAIMTFFTVKNASNGLKRTPSGEI